MMGNVKLPVRNAMMECLITQYNAKVIQHIELI